MAVLSEISPGLTSSQFVDTYNQNMDTLSTEIALHKGNMDIHVPLMANAIQNGDVIEITAHPSARKLIFIAPCNYNEDHTYKLNGAQVSLVNLKGEKTGGWVIGKPIPVLVNGTELVFNSGGVGGGSGEDHPSTPPENYTFLQSISASGTWKPEVSGWYQIHAIGQSGRGGHGGSGGNRDSSYSTGGGGAGGGGGASGGYSVSTLYLKNTESIPVTVNASVTSFGAFLSATAGGNGSSGGDDGGIGGAGSSNVGIGSGGNVLNYSGARGGNGGDGGDGLRIRNESGNSGANGGAGGGGGGNNSFYSGGGGGGGGRYFSGGSIYVSPVYTNLYSAGMGSCLRGGSDPLTHAPVYPTTSPPLLFGGGSGGGGGVGNFSSAPGGRPSNGSPGMIIVEKGV